MQDMQPEVDPASWEAQPGVHEQQNVLGCSGVWQHEEYRDLRDRYEAKLQELNLVNARVAAMMSTPGHAPLKSGSSSGFASGSNHGASSLLGSFSSAPTPNVASLPAQSFLDSYRAETAAWVRPEYTLDQLLFVHNYSRSAQVATKLNSVLYDLAGNTPSDAEWKQICKDRKTVAHELLDKDKTWSFQREDMVALCCDWLEMKHERLALCDESRWKAVMVLKARFEESRKPITAGQRNRKKSPSIGDGMGGDQLDIQQHVELQLPSPNLGLDEHHPEENGAKDEDGIDIEV